MPKKLNLSTIKVTSFVTSLNDEEKEKFKGGTVVELTSFDVPCHTCTTPCASAEYCATEPGFCTLGCSMVPCETYSCFPPCPEPSRIPPC